MHQPPGFENTKHPEYVYKLKQLLYCLKHAPRAWYVLYPKIFHLISQRIILDPQACFHPIANFELQNFQENHSQRQNSHLHTKGVKL